ncbi:unnamed protein product [Camellia sinensis]
MLHRSSQTRNLKRKYYVYNHTTKQFTTLPTLGFGSPRPVVHGVNFAFNPAKSPHYKVMCVQSSDFSSEHYQIKIYSSNTGPWRVSGQPFTAHVNIQFNGGVYWNGAIHWLSIRGDPLCFGVDKKCLQIMPMPPLPSGYLHFHQATIGGGLTILGSRRPFRVVCEVSNRPWFSCC